MPEQKLVDNDIILKVCCFGLGAQFKDLFGEAEVPVRLGLATFVVPRKIAKSSRVRDKKSAQAQVVDFLAWAVALEPTEDELSFASEIEDVAREENIDFDAGESQLLAVLLRRNASQMMTGDKRAMIGLRALSQRLGVVKETNGKVVCFEQILLALLKLIGAEELTRNVCAEPEVDRTASICCSCASGRGDEVSIAEGLTSYIRHLRAECGECLAA